MMITTGFPILSTPDIERSLTFWRDLLGGQVYFSFPDDGPPGYVAVQLGGMRLGIGLDSAIERDGPIQRISIWLYVDDCDAVTDHLRSAGIRVTEEPEDQVWGERMARVLDPDGNEVVVATESTVPTED